MMKLTVKQLVVAHHKKHAVEMAWARLNIENVSLRALNLVDERGTKHKAVIQQMESIVWLEAEQTDISSRYNVMGEMYFHLSLLECGNDGKWSKKECFTDSEYWLPPSVVSENSILAISSSMDKIFLEVLQQLLVWNLPAAGEDEGSAA